MKLPQGLPQTQMENMWATVIEPFLNSPPNLPLVLQNIKLVAGSNVIDHKLGRKLQGWKPVRIRALANIYDNQDNNRTPQLTLLLVSNAAVTIDLEVF